MFANRLTSLAICNTSSAATRERKADATAVLEQTSCRWKATLRSSKET
jgi:hypothetical protein